MSNFVINASLLDSSEKGTVTVSVNFIFKSKGFFIICQVVLFERK